MVKLNLQRIEEQTLRKYIGDFLRRTLSKQYANQKLNRIFGKCIKCGKPIENLRGDRFRGSSEFCEFHSEKNKKRGVKHD